MARNCTASGNNFNVLLACGAPITTSKVTDKEKPYAPRPKTLAEILEVGEEVEVIVPQGEFGILCNDDHWWAEWEDAKEHTDGPKMMILMDNFKVRQLKPHDRVKVIEPMIRAVRVEVLTGIQRGKKGVMNAKELITKDRLEKWKKEAMQSSP